MLSPFLIGYTKKSRLKIKRLEVGNYSQEIVRHIGYFAAFQPCWKARILGLAQRPL
jgi:hypothetical protein